MYGLSVTSNVDAWTRHLTGSVARQVPFALAVALTDTARLDCKPAAERLLSKRIDRPTPFTKKGFGTRGATKRRLVSQVFFKDTQADYMTWAVGGGEQRPKNRALLIPVGTRRNQYGNMSRNAVRTALAKPNTFSGTVNGVPGVWQRMARGRLKLLIRYEDKANYKPILPFHREMAKVASNAFPARFGRSLERAIRTAR